MLRTLTRKGPRTLVQLLRDLLAAPGRWLAEAMYNRRLIRLQLQLADLSDVEANARQEMRSLEIVSRCHEDAGIRRDAQRLQAEVEHDVHEISRQRARIKDRILRLELPR